MGMPIVLYAKSCAGRKSSYRNLNDVAIFMILKQDMIENLKGLQIGMVFRRRQYEYNNKLKVAIDMWYLCSIDIESLLRAYTKEKESSDQSFDPIPTKATQVQTQQVPVDVWYQQPIQSKPTLQSQPVPHPQHNIWDQPVPAPTPTPSAEMKFGDVFPDWQMQFQSIPEPTDLPFM